MERWQSTFEHRVDINLSESGVHPLTVDELIEISGTSTSVPPCSGTGSRMDPTSCAR